ncbi:MAG: molybdopterin cofactor-binding domain-containing protein [Xanthobacteraceae bacterium]
MTALQQDYRNAQQVPNRRGFMVGAAGLTLGFSLGLLETGTPVGNDVAQAATGNGAVMNPWVTIASDGTVAIISPATEMGQGSTTSLPLIIAEELDADWSKVRIVPAPPIEAIYGNPGFYGSMYTAGSATVTGYFKVLRQFGAQVRRVLLDNAARHWSVPVEELTTEPNVVVHLKSGRRMGYGEIAGFASVPEKAPEIAPEHLKQPSRFRLIGKDVMRSELPSKVNGSARYSIDVQVPDMLYGAVLRAPIEGSSPEKVDDAKSRAITGVVKVVKFPFGVGVVAQTPWAAFAAKNALAVTWSRGGKAQDFDSDEAFETYTAVARGTVANPVEIGEKVGDASGTFAKATSVMEGEYRCDYAYHAQMEPLNALASVSPAGDTAEIWCGTQSQPMAVDATAKALGIPADKVVLHDMLMGGGFGRRGNRDQEFVVDAVLLSKEVKRPVKVMWTREDDVHNGRFRPLSVHILRAGFDPDENPIAWHHRYATDNAGKFQDPQKYNGPWKQRDVISIAGADIPSYAIPNRLAEHFPIDTGIRVVALRGIGFVANKFATEVFIDEIAYKRGIDPLAWRLELLKNAPRARKVVESVAAMAKWDRKRDDRGLGLAYIDYSGTSIAGVAEVSVERRTGQIRVFNFWVAIDQGIAVQPDNIIAQTESSVVYGLGLSLTERISIKHGEVQESNFYDYTVMRNRDVPEIHVEVIATDNHPTGVGQMATPLVGPALSNAVAALTGARVRHSPLLPERVLAVIKA